MLRRRVVLAAVAVGMLVASRASAQGPRIVFVEPPGDARVAGPSVAVVLAVEGATLAPAGSEVKPGEGHLHVYVDRAPADAGTPIPVDQPDVVHLGKPPFDARSIQLPDGKRTLTAQLGDASHKALPGEVAQVTLTVAPGFRGSGPLEPACAEVATGSGTVQLTFPKDGGNVQGAVRTSCSFKTEGGACSFEEVADRRIAGRFDARTGAVSATVSGSSERRLVAGPSGRCGGSHTSRLPDTALTGSFADGIVAGSVVGARFSAREGEVDLVTPGPAAPAPAASAAPKPARSGGMSSALLALIALGIVVAVGAVLTLVRRRSSGAAPAAAPPAAASAPPRPAPPKDIPAPAPAPSERPVSQTVVRPRPAAPPDPQPEPAPEPEPEPAEAQEPQPQPEPEPEPEPVPEPEPAPGPSPTVYKPRAQTPPPAPAYEEPPAPAPAAPSGAPGPIVRFCPDCGVERRPGSKFCTACGHLFE